MLGLECRRLLRYMWCAGSTIALSVCSPRDTTSNSIMRFNLLLTLFFACAVGASNAEHAKRECSTLAECLNERYPVTAQVCSHELPDLGA